MGKPELAWDTLREEIQTHLELHGGIQMIPRLAQELAEMVQVWDNESWDEDDDDEEARRAWKEAWEDELDDHGDNEIPF